MVTLLTVGNSEGERRCDEKCYNATQPKCECCCGGRNHGVGLKQAAKNTQEHAYDMIREHEERTGRLTEFVFIHPSVLPEQTELFPK